MTRREPDERRVARRGRGSTRRTASRPRIAPPEPAQRRCSEALRDDAPRRPTRLRTWPVTAARNDVPLERQQPDVGDRPDRRRPGHVAEQRDLAERRARPLAPDRPSVDLDLDLALVDDVEPVAALALPGSSRRRPRRRPGRGSRRGARSSGGASGREHRDRAAGVASSRTWTTAAASTPRRLRQLTATTSGSQRPTTTSAACAPRNTMISGTAIEPIAIIPMYVPSSMPKTPGSAGSGVTRWSSVRPATSSSARPTPATRKTARAMTKPGTTPRIATGAPQTRSPSASGPASRGRPTSVTAAAAPRMPPTPAADESAPASVGPAPTRSIATTIISTSSAPSMTAAAPISATTRRGPRARPR